MELELLRERLLMSNFDASRKCRTAEKNPLLLDTVLYRLSFFLDQKSLKTGRLVCRQWKKNCDQLFAKRSRVCFYNASSKIWKIPNNGWKVASRQRSVPYAYPGPNSAVTALNSIINYSSVSSKTPANFNYAFEHYFDEMRFTAFKFEGPCPWPLNALQDLFALGRFLVSDLHLENVSFLSQESEVLPSAVIGVNSVDLKSLRVCTNIPFHPSHPLTYLKINLNDLHLVENIFLENCAVVLGNGCIAPKELTLRGVTFFIDPPQEDVYVHQFVDFRNLSKLSLISPRGGRKNLHLRLTEQVDLELLLISFIHDDWNAPTAKWSVRKFVLSDCYFLAKNEMKVEELILDHCIVEISALPDMIVRLTIFISQVSAMSPSVFCAGEIALPCLKYLCLGDKAVGSLRIFSGLANLVDVEIEITPGAKGVSNELQIESLPRNIRRLKLVGEIEVVGNRSISLDTLIIDDERPQTQDNLMLLYHFRLKNFQPTILILSSIFELSGDMSKLTNMLTLLQVPYATVAFGRLVWGGKDNFRRSNLSSRVDRMSDFYLFRCSKGRAIENREFEDFKRL